MESGEQSPKVSKNNLIFLVLVMGLVSSMDTWLSMIETKAIPNILDEWWPAIADEVARSEFATLQGLFGIIVFGVFFIGWFADAYGRRKGMMLLVLIMGVPALMIVFLTADLYVFLIIYSIMIMGTTSNLWEIPISEEAPAKSRGMYGSAAFLIGVIPLWAILGPTIIDSYGWRMGYGAMFLMLIVVFVLLYFIKDTQRWTDTEQARGEKRLGIMDALRKLRPEDRKYMIIATLVYLTWTISFKMATTFGGEYFTGVLLMTDAEFNSILTIAGLLLPVSALISGILLDKIGRKIVLILGSLGSVICYVSLGMTGMPTFYWGMYFFMSMVLAWIYVYLAEIFPTEVRATSVGVCVTGARLGYVVGPLLAGVLLAMFADMGGFWIVGGLLMLIPLIALAAKPLETKGKTLEEIEAER